jgi:deoxyribose-phosphate aldolase
VAAGAEEIDVVITRAHALTENWRALRRGARHARSVRRRPHQDDLATGELGTLRTVGRASMVHDGGGRLHQDLDRKAKA